MCKSANYEQTDGFGNIFDCRPWLVKQTGFQFKRENIQVYIFFSTKSFNLVQFRRFPQVLDFCCGIRISHVRAKAARTLIMRSHSLCISQQAGKWPPRSTLGIAAPQTAVAAILPDNALHHTLSVHPTLSSLNETFKRKRCAHHLLHHHFPQHIQCYCECVWVVRSAIAIAFGATSERSAKFSAAKSSLLAIMAITSFYGAKLCGFRLFVSLCINAACKLFLPMCICFFWDWRFSPRNRKIRINKLLCCGSISSLQRSWRALSHVG